MFEAILNTNIINFIIVVSTLVLIFKKCRLGDLIEKLAEDIKIRVEKSSQDTKDALDEYKAIKKATKDTPKLQEEIIQNAKTNAQNIKEEIAKNTELKQNELYKSLEKSDVALIEKYKKLTAKEIYAGCIDIAQEEVKKRLDAQMHKKLINSSIDELDKIEGGLL